MQFLLNFMQKAKKLGHSIYGFNRNEHYFRMLHNSVSSKDTTLIEATIKQFIFSKSLPSLSKYMECCKPFDKRFLIKNEETFVVFMEKNKWTKGKELFQLVIKTWKNSDQFKGKK